MTISDATVVRLWPIPRMFQLFFILVVVVTLGVTAWSLIAPAMEAPTGCQSISYESLCATADGSIAQDHISMVQQVSIDYDVLIGVVVAPLIIGVAVAVATPGRSLLGRVWYGAVFVVLAMLIWFGAKILYYMQNDIAGTLGADEPLLSQPTLVGIAVIVLCAMVDAWWQRRRYVWARAWSLLFFEVLLLELVGYSIVVSAQESALWITEMIVGLTAAFIIIAFLIFWRRSVHVAAKFTGLILAPTLLGGYLGGTVEQSLYSYEYIWIGTAIGAVLTYALGVWMIGMRPAPLQA